jgi:putative ABC transport system permease protein
MKYFPLVWAALWRRKLRTWFTLISVTIAFFLFGMLQGVNLGIAGLYDLLTTERLRVASRTGDRPMPLAHLQQIAIVPGITSVTPLTWMVSTWGDDNKAFGILGIDARAWFRELYSPGFVASDEALAAMERTRNGLIVGKVTAEEKGWKVGDRIPIQSLNIQQKDGSVAWEFEIVGIWDVPRRPNWATTVLANFNYINEARSDGANTVMQYIARVGNPDGYAEIATSIDELFANSSDQTMTLSEEDFVRTLLAQVGNISFLLNGVVGAVLFTLLFLTANTMTLSVRERIPELAVLKTLGFTDAALLVMVLLEVLLLCFGAGGLGLGASAGVFPALMKSLGPTVGLEGMRILPSVYAWAAGIAMLLALASGLPPALRAMRLNIVDGLANR